MTTQQPEWATVLTPYGISSIGDISEGDLLWSGESWVRLSSKEFQGLQEVFTFRTSAGYFSGTPVSKIQSNEIIRKVVNCSSMDVVIGEHKQSIDHYPLDVLDGMVFGDGMVHKASNNKVLLCIGKKDQSIFSSEVARLIGDAYSTTYSYKVATTISSEEIPKTYERKIPKRFFNGSYQKKCGFLRGLYTANGSICAKRISLKAASFDVIIQTQEMLSSLGISSYWTTNVAHNTSFNNGVYRVRESYDLNIGSLPGRILFRRLIGFVQPYKQLRLEAACKKVKIGGKPKSNFPVVEKESEGIFNVYSLSIDKGNTYWTGGVLAVI